ncbi:hypothetical protein QP027_11780 [Corynebacterium breve]|uniref:Uncharacterized protein n=1 Tax=Corynebacterium breve TaxID=3049799 RepID=A0ABY8VE10_9CORY|nr:hypothetical protein [Corynebacterium breve]WIM67738.1 hypothetical protein QP027_11780 [Corynebacterium breve]
MRDFGDSRTAPGDTVIAVEAAVCADISHRWTLSELAAIAHLSPQDSGNYSPRSTASAPSHG